MLFIGFKHEMLRVHTQYATNTIDNYRNNKTSDQSQLATFFIIYPIAHKLIEYITHYGLHKQGCIVMIFEMDKTNCMDPFDTVKLYFSTV